MSILRKAILVLAIVIKWIIAAALIILIGQHLISPIYYKEQLPDFTGIKFYNPYQNSQSKWTKMNLHSHSKSWGGITNGSKQSSAEIIEAYKKAGYGIIGVSNYFDPQKIYFLGKLDSLRIYEHGFNLLKAHRLVIGYSPPDFFDVSFFHNYNDHQYILDRLSKKSEFLAVAHPHYEQGHKLYEFAYLKNYRLMEVLNHYNYSTDEWNCALDHGIAINLMANDDMHDLTKRNEFCVRYTMVDTKTDLTSTLQELQNGNAYGVSDPTRVNSMKLKSCLVDSLTIKVLFTEIADSINFIGKGGSIIKTILNDSFAQYTINASDPYIRIESKKEDCSLYLNPIIRSQDGLIPLHLGKCHINWFATIIEKIKLCIFTFFLILLLYKIRYKWRRPKIIMNKEIFSH